ncbi:MAG TPA: hypothetical protein VFN49_02005 [Candidatus Aquilonibacter sp.]|nr:hypothetical protein [Candidatus Aquilonibacter sp.]
MPRQIIDTESSRPAYQRRLALRWAIAIVLILIAIFVAFEVWHATHHAVSVGLAVPGKAARLSNLALLSSRPWGS